MIILATTELIDTTLGRIAELGVVALILCLGLYFMFKYFTKKEENYLAIIESKDKQINDIIEKTIENQIITNETLQQIKENVTTNSQ